MNSQEIEAKFHVKDLVRMETRLRELGAELIQPRVHETNLRFDNAARDMRRAKQVLRLRQDDHARMTFKGPAQKREGVMSRTEIEFIVENFESARAFIEALGYEVTVFYEKYRTTYELDGTHIMLDELPYGDFVEIEGPDIGSIRAVADRLELKWSAAIETSYQALFERVAEKLKLDKSQLAFDAFKRGKPTVGQLEVTPAD
jgi:adenylate cyclase class 2